MSPDLCTVSLLPYLTVSRTISPACGVSASPMLFYIHCQQIELILAVILHFTLEKFVYISGECVLKHEYQDLGLYQTPGWFLLS